LPFLWLLSFLGVFFKLVGQEARDEIKRKKAKKKRLAKAEVKRLKELEATRRRLREHEAVEVERVKLEFARVEKSKRVQRDLKRRIESFQVPLDPDDPYEPKADEELEGEELEDEEADDAQE